MPTETRYMRSDQQTVNGLTAYKLGLDITFTRVIVYVEYDGSSYAYYDIEVAVRHADGTETELLPWTQFASRVSGEGYQAYSFNCPETSLSPTDAVVVRLRARNLGGSAAAAFITEQLGAVKLPASTWTFQVYTHCYKSTTYSVASIFWGESPVATRVENFTYALPAKLAPQNPAVFARSRAFRRP